MKSLTKAVLLFLITSPIFAQNITERSYNCIFSMDTYSTMEAKAAQKGDEVDALFDKAGLTSADARKGDIFAGFAFMNNSAQTFTVKKVAEGYFSITNQMTGLALTVENNSKAEDANVIPGKYEGKDNQIFAIVRDTTKYRFGAFIIAKHSGMALQFNDKGSVVQKKLDPQNRAQVWAFSQRYMWKNEEGYLGLKKLTIIPEEASLSKNSKTASWCYIALPTSPNLYYMMNANTKLFLMTNEPVDNTNLLPQYHFRQGPYTKGVTNSMLFYMAYSDDSKTTLNLISYPTKYIIDVDPASKGIISVPLDKASPASKWGLYEAPRGL